MNTDIVNNDIVNNDIVNTYFVILNMTDASESFEIIRLKRQKYGIDFIILITSYSLVITH